PNGDGENLAGLVEINLNPLRAFAQKNDALIGSFLVAVSDFRQHVGGSVFVATGHFCAGGQVFDSGRNHHGRTGRVRKWFDDRAELLVFGGTFEGGLRTFQVQRHKVAGGRFVSSFVLGSIGGATPRGEQKVQATRN